jgi:hypothetical protein
MARRSPQTQAKRQREVAKAEKRREKAEKRALRKSLKSQVADELIADESTGTDEPETTEASSPRDRDVDAPPKL